MKLIIGLGNPGAQYAGTRHNVGFMLLDLLAAQWNLTFKFESKFNAEVAKTQYKDTQLILMKPSTYMNLSGNAIRSFLSFYKITNKDILVVYDDISLPLGSLRYRPKGSDGGHNGIKSIIYNLQTLDFDRLKMGIGPQPNFMASESYVLQNFQSDQLELLKQALLNAFDSIICYLDNDIAYVQNKYNKK